METFILKTETEATALVSFFADCGISASRKGKVVRANGNSNLLSHLFDVFVTTALI